jgi:hypothetical protein
MNTFKYIHLIVDKGTRNYLVVKNSLFKESGWENWMSTFRTSTPSLPLTVYRNQIEME